LNFSNGSWRNCNPAVSIHVRQDDLQSRARNGKRKLIRFAGLKPPKEDLPPEKDDQIVENQIIQSSVGNDSGIRIHKWGSRIRWEDFQSRSDSLICVQFINKNENL